MAQHSHMANIVALTAYQSACLTASHARWGAAAGEKIDRVSVDRRRDPLKDLQPGVLVRLDRHIMPGVEAVALQACVASPC